MICFLVKKMMNDFEGVREDELIAMEALLDLSIRPDHHPLGPTPTPTPTPNGGGDDHVVTSTMNKKMISTTRVGRKRSRQITLEGIKEVNQDVIREKICRTNIALLLDHLGFEPQSDTSSRQPQACKNINKFKEKKKKTMTTTTKGSRPQYLKTVNPSFFSFGLKQNDDKGKKRKMEEAGLEDQENENTKLRLTMSDPNSEAKRTTTSIACSRAAFNPIFDLNLPASTSLFY